MDNVVLAPSVASLSAALLLGGNTERSTGLPVTVFTGSAAGKVQLWGEDRQ
jgi:hypothetical protein